MFDERRMKAQMIIKGMSAEQLAEKMGIASSTLYRKMKNNGDFSREEIEKIIIILEIEEPMQIFFTHEIA